MANNNNNNNNKSFRQTLCPLVGFYISNSEHSVSSKKGKVIPLQSRCGPERTAALEGMSGQQHAPTALYPRERPGTHFAGGWVSPRAGLGGRKISPPPEFDPRTVQPIAQSLYQLSYPARSAKKEVGLFKQE